MDIKKLLREINDIEIDINRAKNIAARAKESEGKSYIYNDRGSSHLQVDHSIIAEIAEQQLEIAQSKLNKLIEAKETAEKLIKGLLP
ncbi:hypothetical protein M5J15_00220 [Serratia symbiotica]|uniref:hypothetical protein n=1 Tax=Serratia symbiotica TaxID=138074 RepID=UPI001DB402D7|nr:hypothetical protein [Serratia symbiotica]NIG88703.1 hypothetical protein [Serratia symbiotica]USS95767.1 hypothetical protein M5J15_00220 [Serratia symbiotica]